jgi:hypothetical protein
MTSIDNEREKLRRKQKRRLFRLLSAHPSIAKVCIEYDGYGDSGQVEDITYLSKRGKTLVVKDVDLDQEVEDYALSLLPLGWENNAGAFGTIEIAVASRKAHAVHNDRYEALETTEIEDG